MNKQNKNASFGHKGTGEQAVTLAQSLLTGKPLARAKAKDRTPKLKPRIKPRFGRRDDLAAVDAGAFSKTRKGWAFWLSMVTSLVGL
ncbi:MAG TPA: hypothetical protein VIN57_00540 [Magnetovibrio sp.]